MFVHDDARDPVDGCPIEHEDEEQGLYDAEAPVRTDEHGAGVCPACSGPVFVTGRTGRRESFRCEDCGDTGVRRWR